MPENDEQLLNANEAVEYLAKIWGMESYSLVAFRSLRFRYEIKPALSSRTSTFWRRSDLDKIPKPDKSKPRGPRKRHGEPDEPSKQGGCNTSMILVNSRLVGRLIDEYQSPDTRLVGVG